MATNARLQVAVFLASLAACGALAADAPSKQDSTDDSSRAAPAQLAPALNSPAGSAGSSAAAQVPPHVQTSAHHPACLTKSEQRAAVASKSAMSLGDAIKSLRAHGRRGEVVRARLCRRDEKLVDEKLVYVLTLLGRSGRVRQVNVDAVSGDLFAGR
jgi:hypothetical protein